MRNNRRGNATVIKRQRGYSVDIEPDGLLMTLRSAVQLRVGVVNGCREVFNRPELYNTLNVGTIAAVVLHFVTQIRRHRVQRSEERRVGKEWRCRSWQEH